MVVAYLVSPARNYFQPEISCGCAEGLKRPFSPESTPGNKTTAGLVETLQGEGPFTVFAPTDEAFAKLPAGTVEDLLKPENKANLVAILTYHVVPAKVMAADVTTSEAPTVNGKPLSIVVADGKVTVGNTTVVATDVLAENGVIHVIDSVLRP